MVGKGDRRHKLLLTLVLLLNTLVWLLLVAKFISCLVMCFASIPQILFAVAGMSSFKKGERNYSNEGERRQRHK